TGALMKKVSSVRDKVKSRTDISREESMYLYAVEQMQALGSGEQNESASNAFWQWVKWITFGEIAFESGRYSDWHEVRISNAHNRLVELSRTPNDPKYLSAAQRFRRSGEIKPRI
ncbi:MAG: hypothetical protein AAB895_00345, partial [Patescibacteria group bacterium]